MIGWYIKHVYTGLYNQYVKPEPASINIDDSVKKSVSDAKGKITKPFETNTDNNTDYKQKDINDAFDDKCIKLKSNGSENISIR